MIRFAPLIQENQSIAIEQFKDFVNYLSQALSVRIEWVFLTDYAAILDEFQHGNIDLAYLGPLPYTLLKRTYTAAQPLACVADADGMATLRCALVGFNGEPPATVHDIVNMHIALTQPHSTCGYLNAAQILTAAGRDINGDGNWFSYAGSHSIAALGVVAGDYAVASIKMSIAQRYAHLNLKILAISPPYPGFSLVVNTATVNKSLQIALQQALLSLTPIQKPELMQWGLPLRYGLLPPEQCGDYTQIDNALKLIPWPLPADVINTK
ncbi:PhnD/SsuA/transferrin family substrate-binding protein [Rhodoferax sp. 4810]|uniref:PhnD/SsuA/transferrin family substrate-binding protein n=1 Tax=Thiospirillum jenense TaxID=1653858 RepID=A0A839H9T3_9GAMM|nr:PhnD/SsuA/transferrin family substrate-binding protein [Rhodoferax jenense]MBB1125985.1 PhnD/SsuA/transferrin family substrate-binding protein [Thiospirillum jenense]